MTTRSTSAGEMEGNEGNPTACPLLCLWCKMAIQEGCPIPDIVQEEVLGLLGENHGQSISQVVYLPLGSILLEDHEHLLFDFRLVPKDLLHLHVRQKGEEQRSQLRTLQAIGMPSYCLTTHEGVTGEYH